MPAKTSSFQDKLAAARARRSTYSPALPPPAQEMPPPVAPQRGWRDYVSDYNPFAMGGSLQAIGSIPYGAHRMAKDFRAAVRPLGQEIGSLASGVGSAVMSGDTDFLKGAWGGFREGAGEGYRALESSPVNIIKNMDPGIAQGVQAVKGGGDIGYKAGKLGAIAGSLLLPTKGGRAALASPVKTVAGAVTRGLAERSATKAAAAEAAQLALRKGIPEVPNTGGYGTSGVVSPTGTVAPAIPKPAGPTAVARGGFGATGETTIPWQSGQVGPVAPPRSAPRQIPGFGQTSTMGPPFRAHPTAGTVRPGESFGVTELHAPQSVSAGMGRTVAAQQSPATRAFEALVPERYKTDVTPQGLTMGRLGDVAAPPTPGLRALAPSGQFLEGPAAKAAGTRGTKSLAQMVQEHGIEEAASRARMTVEEVADMLAAKAAAKPKYPPPTRTGKQPPPKAPPAVAAAPKAAAPKPAAAIAKEVQKKAEVRMWEKSPTSTVEALAARGNKQAIAELELRKGQPPNAADQAIAKRRAKMTRGMGPEETGPEGVVAAIKRLAAGETGSVGPGIKKVEGPGMYNPLTGITERFGIPKVKEAVRKLTGEKQIPTRPSSGDPGWQEPAKVAEREAAWQRTMGEVEEARDRQNWMARRNKFPEEFERQVAREQHIDPRIGPEEAEQRVFNRFRDNQHQMMQNIRKQREGVGIEKAKVERPPFRRVEDFPAEEVDMFGEPVGGDPYTTVEEGTRLVPSKDWYAGQDRINRTQVEQVKKYGVNRPLAAKENPPYVYIDEKGNYQINDGHHRSTAALEQGKAIPYTVEDASPQESWFRKARGMTGEESPFAQKGKEAARKIKEALAGEEESTVGSRLGNETGAITGQMLKDIGKGGWEVVNQARIASMLSGLALPKSILGNVGAHGVGALESAVAGKYGQALSTLKEGARLPTNIKEAIKGWKGGANPAGVPKFAQTKAGKFAARMNVIPRVMGALDEASQQSLMRSGRTRQEAQRLLLQNPKYGLKGSPKLDPVLDYFVPFRRTPFNAFQEGARTMGEHPFISAGMGAAGYGMGELNKDNPKTLALTAALMGPYTFPYLLGAGGSAGARLVQGLSPMPEWSMAKSVVDPLHPFTDPAFGKLFDEGDKSKKGARRTPRPTRGSRSR